MMKRLVRSLPQRQLWRHQVSASSRRSINLNLPIPLAASLPTPLHSRFLSTESGVETSSYPDHLYERADLDPRMPLSDSVEKLLAIPVGRMHHLDFYNKCPNMMKFCCMTGRLDNARQLLERILQEKRKSGRVVPAKAFEILIFGYAKQLSLQNPDQDIKQMFNLVDLMASEDEYDQQHCKADTNDSCQPTTHTYNTVLRGLARAAHATPLAARRAEEVLDLMERQHRERGWHSRPNTRSFTHVITAYGNMSRWESGDLAQAVLERLSNLHQLELKAYEESYGEAYNTADPSQNKKKIVTPDSIAYTAVIMAHAKAGGRDSAYKALALLETMERPDNFAVAATIHSFATMASKSSGKVRDRVSAEQRAEAAEQAQRLLLLMEDIAKDITSNESETRNKDGAANINVSQESSTEMDLDEDDIGWDEDSRDDGGMQRDEQDSMSTGPSVIIYNACLNAWAKSDTREAAPRADALLQRMIESSLKNANAVRPDLTSFNTVLNAWARYSRYDPESPDKAENLLDVMHELYYSERLKNVKPNAVSYTTVINAWARSGDRQDKVQNARRLLDKMLNKYDSGERDMQPNILAYTSVLNAAAHSDPQSTVGSEEENPFTSVADGDDTPYAIAVQTYNEILRDPNNIGLSPDHFVFAAMFEVIKRHTTDAAIERRQMVEVVFDDACAAGQVSSFLIRSLRKACPTPDLMARLFRSERLAEHLRNVDQLPKKWSRNVDQHPRFRFVDDNKHGHDRRTKQGQGRNNIQ